jgi:hypothetical protein
MCAAGRTWDSKAALSAERADAAFFSDVAAASTILAIRSARSGRARWIAARCSETLLAQIESC